MLLTGWMERMKGGENQGWLQVSGLDMKLMTDWMDKMKERKGIYDNCKRLVF